MKDVFGDMVVELEKKHVGHCIVVVLCGVIVDMGFGGGIAVFLSAGRRRSDTLVFCGKLPPTLVEFAFRKIL